MKILAYIFAAAIACFAVTPDPMPPYQAPWMGGAAPGTAVCGTSFNCDSTGSGSLMRAASPTTTGTFTAQQGAFTGLTLSNYFVPGFLTMRQNQGHQWDNGADAGYMMKMDAGGYNLVLDGYANAQTFTITDLALVVPTTITGSAVEGGVTTYNPATDLFSIYAYEPGVDNKNVSVGGRNLYFSTSPSGTVSDTSSNLAFKINSSRDAAFYGSLTAPSITTGAPTTGTAAPWKLGVIVTAACVLDATTYAQVEINGVFRKVALCQ